MANYVLSDKVNPRAQAQKMAEIVEEMPPPIDALIMSFREGGMDGEGRPYAYHLSDQVAAHNQRLSDKRLAAAHSKFQSECDTVPERGLVAFGDGKAKYKYGLLSDVVDTIKPHLAPNGLSYRWQVGQRDGGVWVTCHLRHIDGGGYDCTQSGMPDDSGNKNILHATASTITYLKRYTLLNVTGCAVKGEDDDGVGPAKETALAKNQSADIDNAKKIVEATSHLQLFPEDRFEPLLPSIESKMKNGANADELMKWLETKGGKLSKSQRDQIMALKKGD